MQRPVLHLEVAPEIRDSVLRIVPDATWAIFKNSEARRQIEFVAGRGPGPCVNLRLVELEGRQVRQWSAMHSMKSDFDWIDAGERISDQGLQHLQPTPEQFESLHALRPQLGGNDHYLLPHL